MRVVIGAPSSQVHGVLIGACRGAASIMASMKMYGPALKGNSGSNYLSGNSQTRLLSAPGTVYFKV